MITYQYGVGNSCCTGYKVTIYKIVDGIAEVLETKTNFKIKEDGIEFAIARIQELNEEEGGE